MKVAISNIPVSLDAMLPQNTALLEREVSQVCGRTLRLSQGDDDEGTLKKDTFRLARRSVDARKKTNVHFVITVVANVPALESLSVRRGVTAKAAVPDEPLRVPDVGATARRDPRFKRPVVVGAGPAGLFCALYLAEAGLAPRVLERGKPVEARMVDVDAFAAGGSLDENSNVQFGEGGAGTFSDGKLTTGTKSSHIRHVLEAFVEAGAPADILIDAKPHIGTDLLPGVVRNVRARIEAAGGEFFFDTRVDELICEGGAVVGVRACNVRTQETTTIETDTVVLAIGHSARDTYAMLAERGFAMERKPFAMGVRIEHLQSAIDAAQYGAFAGHPALGAADYRLAFHDDNGRGVYTFCMCPGGSVVAAASEEGGVCVNGMSRHARDGRNANSAVLIEIKPDDIPGTDPLEGVRLQQQLERQAYACACVYDDVSDDCALSDECEEFGHEVPTDYAVPAAYKAPAQTVGGFLDGEAGVPSTAVEPTYPRGVAWVDLRECLPVFIADALTEALPAFDRRLHGFSDPEAVMTAVEARSSAPVRLVRDRKTLQSVSCAGVYPAGEGAGYAGGIMSAAVDGIRCAEKIVERYIDGSR